MTHGASNRSSTELNYSGNLADSAGFEPTGLSTTTLAGERFKPLSQLSKCGTRHPAALPFVSASLRLGAT